MIKVTIQRQSKAGRICGYCVTGHAGYAEAGKDIVCAGVSAVTIGTVNAAEKLLHITLKHRMKNGLLDVSVPELTDPGRERELQLLLEAMVVTLESIRESYGQYMRMEDKIIKKEVE